MSKASLMRVLNSLRVILYFINGAVMLKIDGFEWFLFLLHYDAVDWETSDTVEQLFGIFRI